LTIPKLAQEAQAMVPVRSTLIAWLLAGTVCPGWVGSRLLASDPSRTAPATAVARVADGTLLHRVGAGKAWKLLQPKEQIEAGDLILAFPDGSLDSANGAVRLTLLSNLVRRGPYPIQDSAVTSSRTPDFDMDVQLDRGRIDISNRRTQGQAKVRLRFHEQDWELTLLAPETRVAVELYGRWLQGTRFKKDPQPDQEPAADLMLIVLRGTVNVKVHENRFGLRAPPGPAAMHWESQSPLVAAPMQLNSLPSWARAKPVSLPLEPAPTAAFEQIQRRLLAGESISAVLEENIHGADANQRGMAVFGLGAIDDVLHLLEALIDSKHVDVRDVAVVALRQWIGRNRGQDRLLYETLVRDQKYPANQAEIVMQLLHGFDPSDLSRPVTYEVLIEYLMHDQPAIRQLAHWHLTRLVRAGRSISYDAAGGADARRQAQQRWKELVPNGKLPAKGTSP
jgi:hypothetical protein